MPLRFPAPHSSLMVNAGIDILLYIASHLPIKDINNLSLTCRFLNNATRNHSLWISIIARHMHELPFHPKLLDGLKAQSLAKLRDVAKSLTGAPRLFGVSYPNSPSHDEQPVVPRVYQLQTHEPAHIEQVDLLPGGRWLLGFSPSTIYVWDVVSPEKALIHRVRLWSLSSEMNTGPLEVDVLSISPPPGHFQVLKTSSVVCDKNGRIIVGIIMWNRFQSDPVKYTSLIQVVSLSMTSGSPDSLVAQRLFTINQPGQDRITNLCVDENYLVFGGMRHSVYMARLPCPLFPQGVLTKLFAPSETRQTTPSAMQLCGPYLFLRYIRFVVIFVVPPIDSDSSKIHSSDGDLESSDQKVQPSGYMNHSPVAYQIIRHEKDCTPAVSRQRYLADGTVAPIRILFKTHVMTLRPTGGIPDSMSSDTVVPPNDLKSTDLFAYSSHQIQFAKREDRWRPGDGAWSFGICGYSGVSGIDAKGDRPNNTRPTLNTLNGWGRLSNDKIVALRLYQLAEPDGEGATSSTTSNRETMFQNDQIRPFSFAYNDVVYHSLAACTHQGKVLIARFD